MAAGELLTTLQMLLAMRTRKLELAHKLISVLPGTCTKTDPLAILEGWIVAIGAQPSGCWDIRQKSDPVSIQT